MRLRQLITLEQSKYDELHVSFRNQPTNMPTTARDVLLYVPNLIGYGRVVLTLVSFLLMIFQPSRWFLALWLYIASFVGDLFDGLAARKFDQCSTYGGLLDMVTDRCATAGLLVILAGEYDAALVGSANVAGLYRLVSGTHVWLHVHQLTNRTERDFNAKLLNFYVPIIR